MCTYCNAADIEAANNLSISGIVVTIATISVYISQGFRH
jgi:hypothetical protein